MDELYVKCKGKPRIDKNTYTREQVTAPNFTDDYGRIVPPGYIVFDFDEQPYINIIYKIITNSKLKCRMLKTTKGYHFMFKTTLNKASDHIGEFSWIGLKCDVKGCGIKEHKQSYQSIRVNGVTRDETLINTDDWDDLDYAPKWMYIVQPKVKQVDLTVDQTGGRNNLFHSELMIRAKKDGFTYDDYVQMSYIINDYVLPHPLEHEELNTAIRPEEWDNLQIGEDKLTLQMMVEDLINRWNCIIGGETLSFYDDRIERYSKDVNTLQAYMLDKYASQNITTNKIEEVIDQMNIIIKDNMNKYGYTRNSEYILCNKHLVSMWKDDVIPSTRTIYTDVYYPYDIMTQEEFNNFNGRAKSFMEEISCNREDVKTVIWECLGCMLAPEKPFGKIFIFYGNGANGKSLLLDIMEHIMGPLLTHANILAINDKFALEQVIEGVANVTDDVGITTLKETGLLKTLVNGSSIEVNRKFKTPIKWKPNSQFVMCCNEIPRIADTTNGMLRRLAFIPFNMQLTKDQIDILLLQKIVSNVDNLRYIMSGAIFAYREAVKRRSFNRIR